jgi:hypothetical protein
MMLAPEGLLVHRPRSSNRNPEKADFAQMVRIVAVVYKAPAAGLWFRRDVTEGARG